MYFVIIGFVSSCKTITPTTWKFTLVFSTKNRATGRFAVLYVASKRRNDGA